MSIFFTSDMHLGCKNLIEGSRPQFSSVEEHDDSLLDSLNSTVSRTDYLYLLGDFCNHKSKVASYIQRIKCRHIFCVLGNHDHRGSMEESFGSGNVVTRKMVKLDGGVRAFCDHYPMAFWDRSHFGSLNLYGHIHNNPNYEEALEEGLPGRRALDVGVDSAFEKLGEYRPFSSDEIMDYMQDRPGHEELWRDVKGYEGIYQVSTIGNVRSLDRQIYHPRSGISNRQGQVMSLGNDKDGYKILGLCKGGVKKTHKVHHLVLETFVGPRPEGEQVLHGPNGPGCNWLVALKYGTQE